MTKFNTETETYCDPNYYQKKSMAFFSIMSGKF